MLTTLRLENFRGFNDHEIPLNSLTAIVGRNNAGKSTIVEALRFVSIVVGRYKNLTYHCAPPYSDISKAYYGVSPSLRNVEIDFKGIFYRYRKPPAIITATFSDRSSVTIYLFAEDKIHAVIRNQANKIVESRNKAQKVSVPTVGIMPQVAPVQREEIVLSKEYVQSAMSSALAPLHFRNQLFYAEPEVFKIFKISVEETWHGVRILELICSGKIFSKNLHLEVQNEDFVGEVAAMGHGLQMWLQIMWFLARSQNDCTIILDEPDVYMHADLQRQLIRYIRNRFPQIILTTHSVEIMSEVSPNEILVIDKKMSQSTFASTLPAVQRIIDNVGSVHNIHLTKLLDCHRFIFIEGKDLKILKQFQDILFPHSKEPFESIPNMPIGGWGGWNYVIGSSMLLENAFGEKIIPYCILDSDYHSEEEIKARQEKAKKQGVELHIWQQKEIENYLIIPTTICRLVHKKIAKRTTAPSLEEVENKIKQIANNMETEVFDALSTEILAHNHSLGSGGANKLAREIIKGRKTKEPGILAIVSGKALISRLSKWCQDEFGISLNDIEIAREMFRTEIPVEMERVIFAIEHKQVLN